MPSRIGPNSVPGSTESWQQNPSRTLIQQVQERQDPPPAYTRFPVVPQPRHTSQDRLVNSMTYYDEKERYVHDKISPVEYY